MKQKLYYGGDIITMTGEHDNAEAILIEAGLIKMQGSLEEVKQAAEHHAEKIDLQGKTLMPAFIDPHGHISMVGQFSSMADLSECNNFNDIIQTLKDYIQNKDLNKGDIVVGFGYDNNFLEENRHPTKEILNQVSTAHPIFLLHASAHLGCTNDLALQLVGIDEHTPDPEGGTIGRVEGSDEPNGYLEENAMMVLQQRFFKDIKQDYLKLTEIAQDTYIKYGITTAQDGASSKDIIELLKALAQQQKLKIDVVAYPVFDAEPKRIMEENETYAKKYTNRFKIGGYKMFLDGSPQGKTAWLTEPYEGEESYRGYAWYKDEQVKQFTDAAINDNVQLLTHCNGDAASDQLLRNYQASLEESNNPNKNHLRPVMIHCQTVRNDQLDKMAELSMIPSIFLAHTYYWGDVHLKNLGEERGRRISPVRSAYDRGLCVNFHQDAPVVKPDMLHTIWCAVNRQTRNGVSIGSEERVSVYEALKAVTINAAYQYFEEKNKGSLEEGKVADLVILDKNPLRVDKMDIKDIQVLETIKDGETIYRKEVLVK
ncbi:amidohydrolase [Oceanobacillus sp. J11TS1]|uniref:amidohydrolase n=1 Tax=Oceanobacillus sp. J11TS1 TaxID=2807191 RepID=UPI001B2DA785|nr:amidohydrolase [Oceanobacillus sp. J11TS1]GIO24123.1 amidohydrolase [Oceanobacillus sp. J11TS1]